ncbi:uncharacterized protein LOC143694816 [Agelaius phoeniceus]|uniref:uncharacterized protein LOC143694816 n=1 Tax=Agelaius phoeniceus TaxID=39638 RepID=UPI004054F639
MYLVFPFTFPDAKQGTEEPQEVDVGRDLWKLSSPSPQLRAAPARAGAQGSAWPSFEYLPGFCPLPLILSQSCHCREESDSFFFPSHHNYQHPEERRKSLDLCALS